MRLIDADGLGIGKANPSAFEKAEYAHGWNSAIEIIQNAPTIEAEPVKHGSWEWMEDMYGAYVRCSECGDEFNCWEADCALTKYCPNCGARMDGDESV